MELFCPFLECWSKICIPKRVVGYLHYEYHSYHLPQNWHKDRYDVYLFLTKRVVCANTCLSKLLQIWILSANLSLWLSFICALVCHRWCDGVLSWNQQQSSWLRWDGSLLILSCLRRSVTTTRAKSENGLNHQVWILISQIINCWFVLESHVG